MVSARGTIVILAGPEYEDLELWYPKLRLEEAGFEVKVAGLGEPSYTGKHGYPCPVDAHVNEFIADAVDGIVCPGGWAPDRIRRDPGVLRLVRALHEMNKLVAAICHGPWILISAGIVRGRTLTSSRGVKDDLENAGATWVDEPVVVDGNLVTSRVPKDLPAFGLALVDALGGARR